MIDPTVLTYDSNGLIPVVVQDDSTKDVLMLGYANQETLLETIESLFISTSGDRNVSWRKTYTT